jgi:hypothetical protein
MKQVRKSEPADEAVDPAVEEDDGREVSSILVSQFVRMWPREIFDAAADGRSTVAHEIEALEHTGVYILYRDDKPFYIDQAKKTKLRFRLRQHATNPNARRYISGIIFPPTLSTTLSTLTKLKQY